MRRSTIAVAIDCLREIRRHVDASAPHGKPSLTLLYDLARDAEHFLLSTDADDVDAFWAEHCEHGRHRADRCDACREEARP